MENESFQAKNSWWLEASPKRWEFLNWTLVVRFRFENLTAQFEENLQHVKN